MKRLPDMQKLWQNVRETPEAARTVLLRTFHARGASINPANRFELTKGRDLIVDPAPATGPINFLAYPLLEMLRAAQQEQQPVVWGV